MDQAAHHGVYHAVPQSMFRMNGTVVHIQLLNVPVKQRRQMYTRRLSVKYYNETMQTDVHTPFVSQMLQRNNADRRTRVYTFVPSQRSIQIVQTDARTRTVKVLLRLLRQKRIDTLSR